MYYHSIYVLLKSEIECGKNHALLDRRYVVISAARMAIRTQISRIEHAKTYSCCYHGEAVHKGGTQRKLIYIIDINNIYPKTRSNLRHFAQTKYSKV